MYKVVILTAWDESVHELHLEQHPMADKGLGIIEYVMKTYPDMPEGDFDIRVLGITDE
jgi:hypothetical protein